MPNRILREGINDSERVNALSEAAELFYRKLMSVVDDFGRFEANAFVLHGRLYALRPDRTVSDVQAFLDECTAGDEPLITVYSVGRKKYLQVNGFGQRERTSRFPAPAAESRKARQKAAHAGAAGRRAPNSPSHTHTTSHSQEGGAGGNQNGATAGPAPPEERQAFDDLAADYPQAGRTRLQRAFGMFQQALREECKRAGSPPGVICAAMHAGLDRWRASELWRAGKVHWLGNWLGEGLWREDPLTAAESSKSRAGPRSKRDQGIADFRRMMAREMEEQGAESTGLIHRTGSQ